MTNKQAYAGLLPCPFCGGEPVMVDPHGAFSRLAAVYCEACEIKGPLMATADEAAAAWNTRPEAAEAISSLLKRVGELRELLVKHAVHEEFDYPGDAPESCGFWCDICNQHVDDDNPAIGHAETCALNSDAPLSIGEEQ